MKYVTAEDVKKAYMAHMMKYRGYDEQEAEDAAMAVPSRYEVCWLIEDRLGEVEIDGEEYVKCAVHTMFFLMGIYNVPMFRYYVYYRVSDIPNESPEEYAAARTLYQLDDLDPDDFPGDMV